MNTHEHAIAATRTLPDLGSVELNLSHMALGLAGELGELVNCTGTELKLEVDLRNLIEELGDFYWYAGCYCKLRNLPIPDSQHLKVSIEGERCFELLIQSVSDIVDQVKRLVAYHKAIDHSKELDAIYDIYVALRLFEDVYELDGNEVRAKNIAKLVARYPEKYSDEQAINRNLENERKALEDNA